MKRPEGLGDYRPEVIDYYNFVTQLPYDVDARALSDHPAHLEIGTDSLVFSIKGGNVGRLAQTALGEAAFRDVEPDKEAIADRQNFHRRIAALDRAVGACGLEQLVAYDTELPAVVTKRVLGHVEWKDGIFTAADYHNLFDRFETLEVLGLDYDGSSANTFFVPRKGFTIIDFDIDQPYHAKNVKECVVEFGGDHLLDPWHNIRNARQYVATLEQRYGPAMVDEVIQTWGGLEL